MADANTIYFKPVYEQIAPASLFLTNFFNFVRAHNSKEVELDIVREEENLAPVVTDLHAGPVSQDDNLYTSKRIIPPIHLLEKSVSADDMYDRQPGVHPYDDPNFMMAATAQAAKKARTAHSSINRSIEYQASQVLTSGVVNLQDQNGNNAYTVDYKPKASHFTTAGTAWDQVGADPIGDIKTMCETIRNDGLSMPDTLVMGCKSFEAFIANDAVQKRLDTRRIDMGNINGMDEREDGSWYNGDLRIGNAKLAIWTYSGRYNPLGGGAKTQFVPDDKVIVIDSRARMDATYGMQSTFSPMDPRVARYIPSRLTLRNGRSNVDMHLNAYLTPNNRQLIIEIGSRPLLQPVAIDKYGCITTGVT